MSFKMHRNVSKDDPNIKQKEPTKGHFIATKGYMTPWQAGLVIGVTKQYVNKLITRGRITGILVLPDGQRLIPVPVVMEFKARRDNYLRLLELKKNRPKRKWTRRSL